MKNPKDDEYSQLLDQLAEENPVIAGILLDSQSRRERNLQHYLKGVRLKGFEELINYLNEVHSIYLNQPRLSAIAFLIARSKKAFIIALEAALSDSTTVAHDAMRTVMEIEFLLRDFSLETARIDEWLRSTGKELRQRFQPAVLRQRFADHVGVPAKDLQESQDYRGHSRFLHVGPRENPFESREVAGATHPFSADSCFWEIFEHCRRLLIAIEALAEAVQPGCFRDHSPESLENLGKAWVRTREMQQIWLILSGSSA